MVSQFRFGWATAVALFFVVACGGGDDPKGKTDPGLPCEGSGAGSTGCDSCLLTAKVEICASPYEEALFACAACSGGRTGCDAEICSAKTAAHERCWAAAAKSLCGGSLEVGTGGTGGSGGGQGGSGGTGAVGGDGGTGTGGTGAVGGTGGTGATGGTGGSGGTGGVVVDGCGDVPAAGICADSSTVRSCIVAPDRPSETMVVDRACETWERCAESAGGAACVIRDDACKPGATQCTSETEYRSCGSSRVWSYGSCSGCTQTPVGAMCNPGFATERFTGTLLYEHRLPYSNFSDWSEPLEAPAGGLLALSTRDGDTIDATVIADDGTFALRVPSSPRKGDLIQFYAIRAADLGTTFSFAVADPGLSPGSVADWVDPDFASYWRWELSLPRSSGQEWLIREANWSASIWIFQWMDLIWDRTLTQHGRPGAPLIAFIGPDVSFSCGACILEWPVDLFNQEYPVQMFISGDHENMDYWSAAVLGHELGHWAMRSYGTSPNEGGQHCLGVPVLPGLAWSEGWATFFSSDIRGDPRFWSKQQGTLFWADIDTRRHWGTEPFRGPSADGGLHQKVVEDWVSAALWDIARAPDVRPNQLHTALASRRMNRAPFGRGYTTKRFDVNQRCEPINVQDTGRSAPMIADFLDALRCDGVPAATVTAAVTPYPYPVDAPICP